MNNKNINVLLITGAINIEKLTIPGTKLIGEIERLNEYIYSIEYALDYYKNIFHIVFCENTNYKFNYNYLIEKAKLQNKTFEPISFQGNYKVIEIQGKGFGEGEIIEYALIHSKTLANCSSFYKLTGRLVVKNMDRIIRTTRNETAFDFYPYQIYRNKIDYISTTFYKVNYRFYLKVLADSYKEVNDSTGHFLEHIFYERLKFHDIYSFKILPRISGKSGSTGKAYDFNEVSLLKQRFLYFVGIHNITKSFSEKVFLKVLLKFMM